jgi:divalent metal cation (Fe/Co/Zn/Cd) transporter
MCGTAPYNSLLGLEMETSAETRKAIHQVQLLAIVWMCIEAAVSIFGALRAHSVALLAFGGDSAIELFSAVVVLVRFSGGALSERRAAGVAALLLFVLAVFVIAASVGSLLVPTLRPERSYLGIVLLVAAAAIMPWLAKTKRKLAAATNSAALAADAMQSSYVGSWLGSP